MHQIILNTLYYAIGFPNAYPLDNDSPVDSPIYLWDNRGLLSDLLGKCCDCLSPDAWTSPSLSINIAKITRYKNSHKHLPFKQQKTPDICSNSIFNLPMCNHEGVTWVWKLSLATTKHHPTYFEQNKKKRKKNQKILKAVLLFPSH